MLVHCILPIGPDRHFCGSKWPRFLNLFYITEQIFHISHFNPEDGDTKFPETMAFAYNATRSHNPEDLNLNIWLQDLRFSWRWKFVLCFCVLWSRVMDDDRWISTFWRNMKMEAVYSSEMLIPFYQTKRRHIPDESSFLTHCRRTSDLTCLIDWLIG
jgi:hypothetical protein